MLSGNRYGDDINWISNCSLQPYYSVWKVSLFDCCEQLDPEFWLPTDNIQTLVSFLQPEMWLLFPTETTVGHKWALSSKKLVPYSFWDMLIVVVWEKPSATIPVSSHFSHKLNASYTPNLWKLISAWYGYQH